MKKYICKPVSRKQLIKRLRKETNLKWSGNQDLKDFPLATKDIYPYLTLESDANNIDQILCQSSRQWKDFLLISEKEFLEKARELYPKEDTQKTNIPCPHLEWEGIWLNQDNKLYKINWIQETNKWRVLNIKNNTEFHFLNDIRHYFSPIKQDWKLIEPAPRINKDNWQPPKKQENIKLGSYWDPYRD